MMWTSKFLRNKYSLVNINKNFESSYLYSYKYMYDKIFLLMLKDKIFLKLNTKNVNSYNLNLNVFIVFSITLKNILFFEDQQALAATLILKYITGAKPFISKFSTFKTYTNTWYNVEFTVIFFKMNTIWNFLEYYNNTFLGLVPKSNIVQKIEWADNEKKLLVIHKLKELNFLKIVTFHSIFLKWNNSLNINFIAKSKKKFITFLFFNFFCKKFRFLAVTKNNKIKKGTKKK